MVVFELWKDIDGYKYQYKISDMADIIKFDPQQNKWVKISKQNKGRRMYTTLVETSGFRRSVCVVNLMADAFMGGKKPGECITYKNGSKTDCCLYNLEKTTKQKVGAKGGDARRRAVRKVDARGRVVEVYPSLREASKHNFISYAALQARLYGKVKNPYRLDGFNYVYDERKVGRKNKWEKVVF